MSPAEFLSLTILLTAMAGALNLLLRRVRLGRLRQLAEKWQMTYSPRDQFRLTPRVARDFPVPGAAKIHVADLIYGIEADNYRYVFTVEYTAGVVGGKRRVLRAGSFTEPRDKGTEAPQSPIMLAPAHLALLEQYQRLTPPGIK